MLSRTAANLYWLGRYLERAESIARLCEASLGPGNPNAGKELWKLALKALGLESAFEAQFNTLVPQNVHEFLCWGTHLGSIHECLYQARENARAVRSRITTEMWEAINQTWLELPQWRETLNATDAQGNLKGETQRWSDFYDWIRQRAYLFQGATQGTLPRSEGRSFLRLGTFLERGEQTLRVLWAHDQMRSTGTHSDYYHWNLLLKAVSALEAYQVTHSEVPDGHRVVQVLLFHRAIPRSLRYCSERVLALLEEMHSPNSRQARRAATELLSHFHYDSMEEILVPSLGNYLQQRLRDTESLGLAIQNAFLEPA
jgi:uncharacterized alpha-E superfamily protein